MMNKKLSLRWGILSTALINRSIIPPIRELEGNEVVGVASRSKEKAESFSKLWKIPKSFSCYEALLEDPEIDVVYISLPNSLHAEWALKATKARKHVLCEKPLALIVKQIDRMFAAARKNEVVLAEALMYRHHSQTIKVKELIDRGTIGKVHLIRGEFTLKLPFREGNIRLDPTLGGGCLWDLGYYPISFARYVVGYDPQEAFGWQITGKSGVDESFIGQLCFPGQIYAQFDCSFGHPLRNSMEFVGSEGTISIACAYMRSPTKKIIISKDNNIQEISVDTKQHRYFGQIKDMNDTILFNKAQRISHAEIRGNVATVNALIRSAKETRVIPIHDEFARVDSDIF